MNHVGTLCVNSTLGVVVITIGELSLYVIMPYPLMKQYRIISTIRIIGAQSFSVIGLVLRSGIFGGVGLNIIFRHFCSVLPVIQPFLANTRL